MAAQSEMLYEGSDKFWWQGTRIRGAGPITLKLSRLPAE